MLMNATCYRVTLQYFFSDPFNIRQNSLFKISILAWTCYMHLAVDVIRQYVVWNCMISKMGGGGTGDISKMTKISDRKHSPENVHGNLCCVNICRQLDHAWRRAVCQCCLRATWLSNFRNRNVLLAHCYDIHFFWIHTLVHWWGKTSILDLKMWEILNMILLIFQ